MSSRAEGCDQWLSSKDKRSIQLPQQKDGKRKKANQKVLSNFATSIKRSGGLDIQVSSSPLSPRTRKKLKNAKQSKINKYFSSEARSNVSKRDKKQKDVSESEGCLEGKRAKITVKRQRNENISDIGYSTEETWGKEKENKSFTDLNISGISHLSDSFEDSDEPIETNSPDGFVPGKNGKSRNTHSFSPPLKKFRTSKNGESWTQSSPIEQSSIASEASQPFHFSQWKKDQIAKCKEIQDEMSIQGSSFTDSSVDISQWKREQIAKCKEIQDEMSIEGSSFTDSGVDFSQWKREQIAKCKEIQDEMSPEGSSFTDSGVGISQWKRYQIAKWKEIQDKRSFECSPCSDVRVGDFTQWRREQIAKCKQTGDGNSVQVSPNTEVSGVISSVDEPALTLDHGNVESEFSETPPFQFTQWANQQMEICREMQKGGTDEIPTKPMCQSLVQKGEMKFCSRDSCSKKMLKRDSEPNGHFPDWAKFREATSTDLRGEIQEESASSASEVWKSEKWDDWAGSKRDSVDFITQSLHNDESEFHFSDWVKSQIRKCRAIQEETEEED